MDKTIKEIVDRTRAGERFAVGLLAHVQGSAPQKAGARIVVLPDGTMHGTVGGGCLEMETRRRALLALRTGDTSLFELRLDDDFGWDDGLICGGRTTLLVSSHPERMADGLETAYRTREEGRRALLATVLAAPEPAAVGRTLALPETGGATADLPFPVTPPPGPKPALVQHDGWKVLVEPVRPSPTVIVMGCGHVGTDLVDLAASVGFDVIAVDDRADFASERRLPAARRVVCSDMVTAARELPSGPDTYWVIVTRGHRNDGRVLAEMIGRDYAYVGMIGSRRKVRLIREGMLAEGVATAERIERLHAPIGLDIGAESPREIALSIVAQLVAVRYGKAM